MARSVADIERTFRGCDACHLQGGYDLYWDAAAKRWFMCRAGQLHFTDCAGSFKEALDAALAYLRRLGLFEVETRSSNGYRYRKMPVRV